MGGRGGLRGSALGKLDRWSWLLPCSSRRTVLQTREDEKDKEKAQDRGGPVVHKLLRADVAGW